MMTGTGGWPLNMIITPEKKPFYAATYIPRTSQFGRIGLLQLVPQIQRIWQEHRDHIRQTSDDITRLVQRSVESTPGRINEEILDRAYGTLLANYDPRFGGFGNAPKFPTPQNLSFLVRYASRTRQQHAIDIVEHTLGSMRRGGIYDQIGFGFHRYSTDAEWRLPHFEKMLYDQALISLAYTEAFQYTRRPVHRTTAQETIEYVLRDLTSQQGCFYSAEDADVEGQEGKFYLWEEREIREILDPEEAVLFERTFNIQRGGNYVDEATQRKTGKNILYMKKQPNELALELNITQQEFMERIAAVRTKVLNHRQRRTHPRKDEKILCDWNGLMIAALARAGRIFSSERYVRAASTAADFLLATIRDTHGMLHHSFTGGRLSTSGFLDDYVFLIWGLIELYEAAFNTDHLRAAVELTGKMMHMFWDNAGGAFFFTPENNGLPSRTKEIYDGAIPSGNSVAMMNMLRLSRLTGTQEFERTAQEIAQRFAGQVQKNPTAHMQAMIALSYAFAPGLEVVLSGPRHAPNTAKMLDTINSSRLLDIAVVLRPSEDISDITNIAPFTAKLPRTGKAPTAYLCRDHGCEKPITDPAELENKLTACAYHGPQ
jgi:uncharacterized protein YyaL (SSP411 family)